MVKEEAHLYVVFGDLKSAYDIIPRCKLWSDLGNMRFQVEILYILIRLHKENYALVRCGKKGELTSAISIQKGVRQG